MSQKPKRIFRVNLSLTANEHTALVLLSKLDGLPVTTYARRQLTGRLHSGIVSNWEELIKQNVTKEVLVKCLQ